MVSLHFLCLNLVSLARLSNNNNNDEKQKEINGTKVV